MIRFILLTALTVMGAVSCNSQTASVKNIGVAQFEQGISKSGIQLVDVRTEEEYTDKHISGSQNININGSNFEKKMQELDRNKPLYIYCLAGGRSRKAADWALANGFKEVYNLEFGINSWIAENKPVVSGSGEKVNTSGIGMSFNDYLNRVKGNGKLVLVDFNAVWCGPCKILKPIVQKVVRKNSAKVELLDIDVDKNVTVSNTMNVRSIPLLILYKDGKEVWRQLGLIDEAKLNEVVNAAY